MRLIYCIRKMATADISALRFKYNDKTAVLLEKNITRKEPIHLFQQWLKDACDSPEIPEPNAMCLATATKDCFPSARFVLLKGVSEAGFTFFTNYGSRKAIEIAENPNVALTMYWYPLKRSVRIEGVASKITREDSEKYFHERPRPSQIGALASPQSKPIPNRAYLDQIEDSLKKKFGSDDPVPMPDWGGYLVTPRVIEFWQGQSDRLHDRLRFRKSKNIDSEVDNNLVHLGENGWVYERLAP